MFSVPETAVAFFVAPKTGGALHLHTTARRAKAARLVRNFGRMEEVLARRH